MKSEQDKKAPIERRPDVFYIFSENAIAPKSDPAAPVIALFEWLK